MNFLTDDDEDVQEALVNFFKRSVAARPNIVREPFIVQSDSQVIDTNPFVFPDPPKAGPSNPNRGMAPPIPKIDSFYPYWGYINGGETVDIMGSNFRPNCTMRFHSQDYNNFQEVAVSFISSTHIKIVTPQYWNSPIIGGYDLQDVEVSNANPFNPALSDSLGTFQYELTPTSGTINGIQTGGFLGNIPSGTIVTWPMVVFNAAVGGSDFYPFIGFFDVYGLVGHTNPSLFFMSGGVGNVNFNASAAAPGNYIVQFFPDGAVPAYNLPWQYTVT